MRSARLASQGGLYARKNVFYLVHDRIERAEIGTGKLAVDEMIEQFHQWIPEPLQIGQNDRMGVAFELRPGHHFHRFFQRADAPRQRDKSVRHLEHPLLSFMHGLGDDQLADLVEPDFTLLEEFGDDTCDMPPVAQNRACDNPHEPDTASTIYQSDAGAGEDLAEPVRSFFESRLIPDGRTAIDADIGHLHDGPRDRKSGALTY